MPNAASVIQIPNLTSIADDAFPNNQAPNDRRVALLYTLHRAEGGEATPTVVFSALFLSILRRALDEGAPFTN